MGKVAGGLLGETADVGDELGDLGGGKVAPESLHPLAALVVAAAGLDGAEELGIGEFADSFLVREVLGAGFAAEAGLALAVGAVAAGAMLVVVLGRGGGEGEGGAEDGEGSAQAGSEGVLHRACGVRLAGIVPEPGIPCRARGCL